MLHRHELSDDITAASVTDLITDGSGVAYLHFDNGVVLIIAPTTQADNVTPAVCIRRQRYEPWVVH
jgi:hypothetical protein